MSRSSMRGRSDNESIDTEYIGAQLVAQLMLYHRPLLRGLPPFTFVFYFSIGLLLPQAPLIYWTSNYE